MRLLIAQDICLLGYSPSWSTSALAAERVLAGCVSGAGARARLTLEEC
jgi:hypothetical protein